MCDIPLPSPKSLSFLKLLFSDLAFKGTLSQLSENRYCDEGLCIGSLPSGSERSPIAPINCLRMGVLAERIFESC